MGPFGGSLCTIYIKPCLWVHSSVPEWGILHTPRNSAFVFNRIYVARNLHASVALIPFVASGVWTRRIGTNYIQSSAGSRMPLILTLAQRTV